MRSLNEAPELKSSINAVSTDIGNSISNIYTKLDIMLQEFLKRNGDTDGFGFVAGGVASRWMAENGDRLISELHDLAKQSGPKGTELHRYLSLRERKFFRLAKALPQILSRLGKAVGSSSLSNNSEAWARQQSRFQQMIGAGQADIKEPDAAPSKTPSKPDIHGQQNSAVEKIVNDTLKRLPSNIAGDVRNAIARSGNKLQALQQELARRNIQLFEARSADDLYNAIAGIEAHLKDPGNSPEAKANYAKIKDNLEKKLATEFPGAKPPAPKQPTQRPTAPFDPDEVFKNNWWYQMGKAAKADKERQDYWKANPGAEQEHWRGELDRLRAQRRNFYNNQIGGMDSNYEEANHLNGQIDAILRKHFPDEWKKEEEKREKKREQSYKYQAKKAQEKEDALKAKVNKSKEKLGQGTWKEIGKEYEDVLKRFHDGGMAEVEVPNYRNIKYGKFESGKQTLTDLANFPIGNTRSIWSAMTPEDQKSMIDAVSKVHDHGYSAGGFTPAQKKKILDAMRPSKAAPKRDYEAERAASKKEADDKVAEIHKQGQLLKNELFSTHTPLWIKIGKKLATKKDRELWSELGLTPDKVNARMLNNGWGRVFDGNKADKTIAAIKAALTPEEIDKLITDVERTSTDRIRSGYQYVNDFPKIYKATMLKILNKAK